jgi:hypothetical protein
MTSTPSAALASNSRDGALTVAWSFRTRTSMPVKWDWRSPPPVHELVSVRVPRSTASNRHIPVTVYSMTNGDVVHLESGLEHDLLRMLDREPIVVRIVAQPCELTWTSGRRFSHIPDLLSVRRNGEVTVWDVRAFEEQDEDFGCKSSVTREACMAVGWRYEVFEGHDLVERLNLMWLNTFRRRPVWTDRYEAAICEAARRTPTTIGNVLAIDDGSGELTAVFWHLLWRGALWADLAESWDLDTCVRSGGGASHV